MACIAGVGTTQHGCLTAHVKDKAYSAGLALLGGECIPLATAASRNSATIDQILGAHLQERNPSYAVRRPSRVVILGVPGDGGEPLFFGSEPLLVPVLKCSQDLMALKKSKGVIFVQEPCSWQ